jgi:hypothetical protein
MPSLAAGLLAASAAIALLGIVHLVYTFRGRKLHPRDAELAARMQAVPLGISRPDDDVEGLGSAHRCAGSARRRPCTRPR